jgi:hypothetical protein
MVAMFWVFLIDCAIRSDVCVEIEIADMHAKDMLPCLLLLFASLWRGFLPFSCLLWLAAKAMENPETEENTETRKPWKTKKQRNCRCGYWFGLDGSWW